MTFLYVVDTNVVVSAFLSASADSPPAIIFRRMLSGDFRFLLSTDLLAEYREVLLRPKLTRKHGLTEDEIDLLLTELAANGTHREPTARPESPDPNDAHLLALLDCEPRGLLVTGDDIMLRALPDRYRVITPREWLDRMSR